LFLRTRGGIAGVWVLRGARFVSCHSD
jgi:hypothetical protein